MPRSRIFPQRDPFLRRKMGQSSPVRSLARPQSYSSERISLYESPSPPNFPSNIHVCTRRGAPSPFLSVRMSTRGSGCATCRWGRRLRIKLEANVSISYRIARSRTCPICLTWGVEDWGMILGLRYWVDGVFARLII